MNFKKIEDPSIRFMRWIIPEPNSGCWLWIGEVSKFGYPRFTIRRKHIQAHRFSYLTAIGEIPKGKQLDHLCRTPSCVNPKHLEPVTARENLHRGNTVNAINVRKTHCPQGHEYTGRNLRITNGKRYCRKCCAIKELRRYHQNKKLKRAINGSENKEV